MVLNRVELGKIKSLFKRINKLPIQKTYWNKDKTEVCIMSALALDNGSPLSDIFHFTDIAKLDGHYANGLRQGWDGVQSTTYFYEDESAQNNYKIGLEDGNAAWEEVNGNS